MDNRADHDDWALVYTELEQLFNLNPGDEAGQKFFESWYKSTIAREISTSSLPPLHVAAALGLCGWAEQLLKKRQADPNESVELFHTEFEGPMAFYPLLVAINLPMLRLLLENKADINAGKESALPIFLSLMFQDSNLESMRLMLHHGADATVSSFHGFNAFHLFAAVGDDAEALQLLLDHSPPDHKLGINAAATDESVRNFTPLHILFAIMRSLEMASASGDLEVLKALCENQKISEIDDGGSGGRTALHTAAGNNHADCVQFLLSLGADATIANANGSTALHIAASESQVDAVKIVIECGTSIDANAVDNQYQTPLLLACCGQDKEKATETASTILDHLLDKKVPPSAINMQSEANSTPLSEASRLGLNEIVARLIQMAEIDNDRANLAIDLQHSETGMTVGCGVEIESNTMWFTHEGRKLHGKFYNVRERLSPLLGLKDPIVLRTNFKGPFMWKDAHKMEADGQDEHESSMKARKPVRSLTAPR